MNVSPFSLPPSLLPSFLLVLTFHQLFGLGLYLHAEFPGGTQDERLRLQRPRGCRPFHQHDQGQEEGES